MQSKSQDLQQLRPKAKTKPFAVFLCIIILPWVHSISTFTKFPKEDTYVASCQYEHSRFGEHEYLEVRGFSAYDDREEGTLYPYDESSAGWCGTSEEAEAIEGGLGQRISFITFDMHDFSPDSITSAVLRMKPLSFPFESTVLVQASCTSEWDEAQLTWSEVGKSGICDDCTNICSWFGSDILPHEMDEKVLQCDVTSVAQEKAGGYLCISLFMEPLKYHSRTAVQFYSREVNEKERRPHVISEGIESEKDLNSYNQGTVSGVQNTWRPHIQITSESRNILPV
mmetsp:Transcript_35711/g.47112  ORF Transcript_35711/g.47112 Transcript_35711/m.47112 type:complete len:283 (-) Transcript_35711:147-995(-)